MPGSLSRSMIFLTASAAVMFSGMPELWPSPWPGAPSISGSWYATPGFCDACGMPSMSEPSAMTGLPDPQVAVQAVGMPATPRSMREAVLLQDAGEVLRRLDFLKTQLAEAEDLVHHLLREFLHPVDFSRERDMVLSDHRISRCWWRLR